VRLDHLLSMETRMTAKAAVPTSKSNGDKYL